ncbi:hypothetical protein BASA62_004183 [Batrachochytrium salamandrivorans]|nr:hypothetical protein BASA62_004183 [Batrachochytrium salamandrivorans]
MKPISFAAISFLAITVSAKLPCTNPYQYLHSPSSTTTQSPQHSGQSKVEAELARLTAAYEKEKESVAPIEAKSNIDRQNAIDAGNRMNSIVDRLEELNIDDAGKSELWRKYYEAKVEWVDLAARHNKQYRHYIKIRKERDDAQMALDLLLKKPGTNKGLQ